MNDMEPLLPDILKFQIDQWKIHLFDYTPTTSQIESQIVRNYPAYEERAVQRAIAKFADRYLKVRPLKEGAFLNEIAIKTADRRGLGVSYDTFLQDQIREVLFEHYDQPQSNDSISRTTLLDMVDTEPNRVDQNVYVLWSRGEVDVSMTESGADFEQVQLTEYGRKRHTSRDQDTFAME